VFILDPRSIVYTTWRTPIAPPQPNPPRPTCSGAAPRQGAAPLASSDLPLVLLSSAAAAASGITGQSPGAWRWRRPPSTGVRAAAAASAPTASAGAAVDGGGWESGDGSQWRRCGQAGPIWARWVWMGFVLPPRFVSGDVLGPPGSFTMHKGIWGIGPGYGGGGRLLRRRWPAVGG
jgi:hypothetical protein